MKKNTDNWNTCNTDHHVPYTDEEIELILTKLPTPKNCVILGRVLKRSKGAIRQVFEKAYMSHADVKKLKLEDNKRVSKYNEQIQQVAKKLKLIKGYNVFQYEPKKSKNRVVK